MEGPISFWGYKEQESNLILPEHDDDDFHTHLTLCCTVFLEKLTVPERVKKFPAFCGTQQFITLCTTARHLSPSWASSIQFSPSNLISLRWVSVLPPHLRSFLPSFRSLRMHATFPSTLTLLSQIWRKLYNSTAQLNSYRKIRIWKVLSRGTSTLCFLPATSDTV